MGRGALAKHPQTYAMQVDGGVVIARDFSAVPPAGLDAFRFTHQTQRTAAPGQPVPHAQRLRRGQQPQGTSAGGRSLRLVSERSEEHTSELQSLAYLVCRLLLEK